MRYLAQTFLILFFVFFFAITLIAATFKFGLFNYSFITDSFAKHGVYTKLSNVVKNSVDNQISLKGGNRNDIAILTDLITAENVKDFVNKNLLNLINFINGKSKELYVYLPISKIPGGLIPANISGLSQEMTVKELGERFNIVDLENLPLKNLNNAGLYDYYLLMTATGLLMITLILLVLSVAPGMRFISPGLGFILSGCLTLVVYQLNNNTNKYVAGSFTQPMSINKAIVLTVAQPLLTDIAILWLYLGIGLIIIGFGLLFVRRPNEKNSEKTYSAP